MQTKERIIYLLDTINENKILQVKAIAEELGVSESTIRRDLKELELQGKLKRIHGGAVKNTGQNVLNGHKETDMYQRMDINYPEKVKICKLAAKKVKDGDCIFLDEGTTLVPLMGMLQYRPVTIVTHNYLAVAQLNRPKAQIIVIGGDYSSKYVMGMGSMAQNEIAQFQFDVAFIGCAGIDQKTGMAYTAEMSSREIKKIALQNATRTYLLVDQSKMNVLGFCKFEALSTFDTIISEEGESSMEIDEEFMLVEH